jgi:exosortase K
MEIPKQLPYYIAVILLFILLKWAHSLAGEEELRFLLSPISSLVAAASGSSAEYIPDKGYLHAQLNIIINKSCSGFNFWLICFMMLSFSALRFVFKKIHSAVLLIILFLSTYLLTILINSSRIIFSLFITRLNILPESPWLHEAEGVFIYFSFLIIIYLCSDFLFKKIGTPNEKPA